MTSRTKTYIDLADFVGLRLECEDCGTALDLPMTRSTNGIPLACPNCKGLWFDQASNPRVDARIAGFVEQFRALRNSLSTENRSGVRFGLTIELATTTLTKTS
jgi:Zn-finger nucleic acid-binding protein